LPESSALVSVIVPAYNGERTILRTLSSIVRQKYRPLQLIVVDDAGKDPTQSLVQDFIKENAFFGEFKLVRHDENLGLSRSLNDGLLEARGDFVLILHQDCELVDDDWVGRALAFMGDQRIAVVTGYYGVSDVEDESFVKRAFGVIRKQFHSRPSVAWEEVTFSEGKCDLYRKDLLLKIGGFPTGYRIAGEDLVVSYGLRSLGYSIVKCYDLPVVQRFGGAAESFWGNIGKEFLFGKVMGGVFSEFKLFLFKGVKSSGYSGSRSLHRASQPAFVLALVFFVLFSFLFAWWFVYFLAGVLLVRYLYYILKVYGELKVFMNPVNHRLVESLVTALIGILTDFMYVFGFGYGLIRYSLVKRV
jgi:glycosyltransferase involved in cell wall biosynthesis